MYLERVINWFSSKLEPKRKRTPTVIQMEMAECGAAALSIILSYYGRYVPLEELRYQCGVSRDGCDAYNLTQAAKSYGLTADGYQLDLKDLYQLDSPFIVYWEGNHFVVVEGLHKDTVYINDPATGPRSVSNEEFDKSFTGVMWLMKPESEFKKEGGPPSAITALKRRLHGSWKAKG